ncbi:DoxX family protein [Luteipulveratus mongoliensis]|uniref:Membrane protein n=1 Tax=Luteipulveratus mongoliensis TaxID=571913 RepID=A0A0K1JN36_9MICO|nr:DoxX family protein [Luteipulveratus mongoliensis]AKU18132.1 membrane protein [Luteipulveratus mongoliensis]
MFIVTAVVSVALALILILSAYGKLTGDPRQAETLDRVEVPVRLRPVLAALEIAGAIGLVAGLWLAPLGIAAAIGLVLYFVGAVGAHLRKSDTAIAPALVVGLVAAATLVLRLQTA